jgi:hypothetical protein
MIKLSVAFKKAVGAIAFKKAIATIAFKKAIAKVEFGLFIIFKFFDDTLNVSQFINKNTHKQRTDSASATDNDML